MSLYFNLALRAENSSAGPQAIAEFPSFWADASKQPQLGWEKGLDLFEVNLMAKKKHFNNRAYKNHWDEG